jgi:predicted O-linked N-acetylglucosamine transferase (SPINDLY family)
MHDAQRAASTTMSTAAPSAEVRRNDPCPCGSGKRYKECHGALGANAEAPARNTARELLAEGRAAEAARSARRAVELDANDADAWTVLGLCLETAEPEVALQAWQKAVALAPRHAEAHFRIGDFRRRRGDYAAAIAAYQEAIAAGSTHPVLLNNLGLALQQTDRLADAEGYYRQAVAVQPNLVEANANLADLLRLRQRYADAAIWYTRATALNPNVATLWLNLGACQHRTGALTSARASFERALALQPEEPQALLNLASALNAEQRYAEALPLIEKALAREPTSATANNLLLYVRQQICDWRDFERLFEAQRASLAQPDTPAVTPHNLFALPYTPRELLVATQEWARRNIAPRSVPASIRPALSDGRLRIAYLGPDFRTHPLANLLTEVLERHDRRKFEVFGYSFGPDDRSSARSRFVAAFDHFVDVRAEPFEATAQRIRDDRIGVLFDTSGYVVFARSEIFALRPAPIQINCIGFPGTLGANWYDYILTDRFVSPPEQQANFAERFAYLPHCYLPGDSRRTVAAIPSRADCGLPAAGFVFCCFNASYKILPDMFDIWMRLLRQVPDSVLWLLQTDPAVTSNLRAEAARRGVAQERLLFAPRAPLAEHLARHAAADLFVDTFPCTAHTTANDALFAGLPVLTCAGETFASRVCGSQLAAIGLGELVTYDLAAYEALALELARAPATLADYRARLRANRATAPLFDTAAYTRALEALLWSAWEAG